jgi:uncharacterized ion transporter superfamily protein YfcC
METTTPKKKKPLNSVALLFFIIIAAAILTYIIPAGTYNRVMLNGKPIVDPNSFKFIDSNPATLFDVFVAIPSGMINAVSLLVGALLIGGGLGCIQAAGALNVGIARVIKKMGTSKGNIILIFLFYVFALMGGFMGFIEGSIPFIPIAISIAIGLGYDSIVGVGTAMLGSISGFTCGPTNPFTVAVAQTIAGLSIYSGIGLRIVMFLIIPPICLFYLLRYAKMVKRDPSKSLVADVDVSDLAFDAASFESKEFTTAHGIILFSLIAGICFYVFGSLHWKWSIAHLGAVFVVIAIISGFCSKLGVNGTTETFIKGASSMTGACFIMGVAYGISWILTKAKVLDTIVYFLAKPLTGFSPMLTAIGILIVIAIINLFIPSGSGKALVVMPIVLPIAQIVGIESQVAILAYQFGDGLTNLCTPLLGVLLLALGFGRVPFSKWERFILPLVGLLLLVSFVFMIVAIVIGYK